MADAGGKKKKADRDIEWRRLMDKGREGENVNLCYVSVFRITGTSVKKTLGIMQHCLHLFRLYLENGWLTCRLTF